MKHQSNIRGAVHEDRQHDSAIKHVRGLAEYTDDIPEPAGTLHAYLGVSSVAHARLRGIDLSEVRAAPGVVDVLTAADIPGHRDIGPVFPSAMGRLSNSTTGVK